MTDQPTVGPTKATTNQQMVMRAHRKTTLPLRSYSLLSTAQEITGTTYGYL